MPVARREELAAGRFPAALSSDEPETLSRSNTSPPLDSSAAVFAGRLLAFLFVWLLGCGGGRMSSAD